MATIIQNLNSIITTKNELNSILRENGVDGGEIFSEYPQKFRSVISSSGGGVSYSYLNEKLTYYVEKDELYNSSYATQSYVVDYVNTYAPTPDLSAYATKSYVADYVATYAPQPDLSSYVTYSYAYSEYVNYGYLESKHYLDSIPNTYATYEAISSMGYLTSIPSDYATYSAISEMGYITSIPSEYITQDELSANAYITINDVPTPDLSAYVTKDELSAQSYLTAVPNTYPTYTDISNMGYITSADLPDLTTYVSKDELSAQSYLTAVPNTYPTYAAIESMGYVTGTDIDNASYVSITDLSSMGYVTSNDLPVIDENIIPKENNTYTLGDITYLYSATYTSGLFLHPNNGWVNVSNWQTKFRIDNSDKYYLTSNRFYPNVNGACNLGLSTNKWGSTYTSDLYADNIHNFIWTGTSAEYEALSDYTTYQLYLVKDE